MPVSVEVLAADLTDSAELLEVERAAASCDTLEVLVNCAGTAGYMPFAQLPPGQAESLIDLHVVATTRLARAVLPGMISRGLGPVINVSSGLAFSASLPAPPRPTARYTPR
jgi:short-subunit dehydrogenase